MQPTISLTEKDNTDKFLQILKDLDRAEVLVGVPEDKTSRARDRVTNAGLVYIHTDGRH